jgi:hypothetical protein
MSSLQVGDIETVDGNVSQLLGHPRTRLWLLRHHLHLRRGLPEEELKEFGRLDGQPYSKILGRVELLPVALTCKLRDLFPQGHHGGLGIAHEIRPLSPQQQAG